MSEWIVTNMEFTEAWVEMYGYKRLVRCKDCRHYWKNGGDNSKGAVCLASPKDDAFCSEGRRKDDE